MGSDATLIVDHMFEKDKFSQWLRIERINGGEGYCSLKMRVREEMCNGFGIAHGGISYSLADTALAFASNAFGNHALSIETSIAHMHPINAGDMLFAHAKLLSRSKKIAHYEVRIENETGELVAFFKGVVYQKKDVWEI